MGLKHWRVELETSVGLRFFEASKSSGRVKFTVPIGYDLDELPEVLASTKNPKRITAMLHRMHRLCGKPYSLLTGNCEQIAKEAYFGAGRSEQAVIGSGLATGLGLVALGVSGPVAVIGGVIAALVLG